MFGSVTNAPLRQSALPLPDTVRSTRYSVGWPRSCVGGRRVAIRCRRLRPSSFRRRNAAGSRSAMPMRAPEFWHEPPGLPAGLLAPVGAGWDIAARLRRAVARPYRAPVPVLCVGNLVAGGSGKTPIVLTLAGLFQERGIAVHVVSRGYGGDLAGPGRGHPRM